MSISRSGAPRHSRAAAGTPGPVRKPIPEAIATTVRRIPGVEYADGVVNGYAQFVSPAGKAIVNGGAPTIGTSYDQNAQLSALRLSEGTAPTSAHDVVMDAATAQKYHFKVGDQVRVLLLGAPETFTISGIVTFGNASNLAGATIAAFNLPTAQRIFGEVGRYDAVDVLTAPGADKKTVEHAIAAALPKGVEVVTGQTVANEQASDINQALSFFSTALLVFAFISLFVGGFTIFNTFSITVGQRTRELALLRIVGASRRQVFRSVLAEAFIVGTLASLVGLGLGVLAAVGLEALLKGFGITLPAGALVFEGRTVIVAPAGGRRRDRRLGYQPGPPSGARATCGRSGRLPRRAAGVVAPPDRRRLAHRAGRCGRARHRADEAGHPTRRPGGVRSVHRHRDAGPRRGPPHGERDRSPPRPPVRDCGEARAGEFDAQPSADRPDRLRSPGRDRTGVHHRRLRRLGVEIGHQQRRRCDKRQLHHHQFGRGRRRGLQRRRGDGSGEGTRRQRRLDGVRGRLRFPALAVQSHRGVHRPSAPHGHAAHEERPWRLRPGLPASC